MSREGTRAGFTGTREGMTAAQLRALADWLTRHALREFHHGAAIEADEQAVGLVRNQRIDVPEAPGPYDWWRVIAHPSDLKDQTSQKALEWSDRRMDPLPPLVRNRNIVICGADVLLAAPKEHLEIVRSGTWATVRFARKVGRPVVLFLPSGFVIGGTGDVRSV